MNDLTLIQLLFALPLLFFGLVLAGILAGMIGQIEARWHRKSNIY